MSFVINGSRMQEEGNKMNAGTTVAVHGLYKTLVRAKKFPRTCLFSSKANSTYRMDLK